MRVLQVITDTDRRGAQVFATDLAGGLERRGHELTTVALAPGTSSIGLDVEVLGRHRLGVDTLRGLRRLAKSADVVIAHGSTTGPACWVALRGTGTPFVYRQISDSLFWAPTRRRRFRVRRWMRRADGIVSLSAEAANVLQDHFGVSQARLSIIPNGVPRGDHHPARPDAVRTARRALGSPPDAATVSVLSALVPEKGVDLAIEALRHLPAVHLVIAGDGPERTNLEGRARVIAPGRTHFVGSLADPGPAYTAADVVVLASRGGDSMPAVLIEAGLRGLPSVTTDVGAITEVVDDGVTGLVVQPDARAVAEAVASILGAPDMAASFGAAAEARCLARFEIDIIAEAWERALASSIRPHSAAASASARILQVVTDTDRRGAQVFATGLGEALEQRGHRVTTVALAPGHTSEPLRHHVLGSRRGGIRTILRLRRAMSGHDVVLAHGSTTLPVCALAAYATGIPFVYRQVSDVFSWGGTTIQRARTEWALRRSAQIVALSELNRGQLVRRFGFDPEQISVVSNAVPDHEFAPPTPIQRSTARRQFDFTNRPVVLFVGSLTPEKGPDVAIDTIAVLPDAELVIVGEGPLESELQNRAADRAPGRVQFLGARADVCTIYQAVDVLLLPSRSEAMPAVLIEAGLTGLSSVASSVGAVSEIVIHGRTGLLVHEATPERFARALDAVLSDRAAAERMGTAARQHCLERYRMSTVGANWETILSEVDERRRVEG